jgi:hypothetical protein
VSGWCRIRCVRSHLSAPDHTSTVPEARAQVALAFDMDARS